MSIGIGHTCNHFLNNRMFSITLEILLEARISDNYD